MELFKFILLQFAISSSSLWVYGCEITINTDLPEHNQPLLLLTGEENGFYYPKAGLENIMIETGDSIELACPGGQFSQKKITLSDHVRVECVEDKTFATKDGNFSTSLKNISCNKYPQPEIKTGEVKCARNGVKGSIGFPLKTLKKDEFYSLIDFCHNEELGHTIYAHTKIHAQIKQYQSGVNRVDFRQGKFFKGISLKTVYKKSEQIATMTNLLRSKKLAEEYIHNEGEYFFAKGHLVAKADFIYGSQQRATFSYVNVVPMWQNVNGRNWAKLEDAVRQFASKNVRDLDVWTGSIGILQAEDVDGKLQDIYLYQNCEGKKSVPVPKLLFKVVYDSVGKAGVAFITINNPHLKKLEKDYVICEDVCDKLPWINWKRDKYDKGYTYCCKVDDFRKAFPDLPKFTARKLLI